MAAELKKHIAETANKLGLKMEPSSAEPLGQWFYREQSLGRLSPRVSRLLQRELAFGKKAFGYYLESSLKHIQEQIKDNKKRETESRVLSTSAAV